MHSVGIEGSFLVLKGETSVGDALLNVWSRVVGLIVNSFIGQGRISLYSTIFFLPILLLQE